MRKLNAKRLFCLVLGLILSASLMAFFVSCEEIPTEPVECTITFDTVGGSEVDPIKVMSNEKAEKPDNPTKAGHVFKGWYLDLNDTAAGAFIFDDTVITGDITLYALWQIRQYSVSYQDPDGNAIEGLDTHIADWGTLLQKPDETAIAREGYIVKWYTEAGNIWDFENTKVTSNTVLTYRYITSKDSYNAADIAENFYTSYDRGDLDPAKSAEHYVEGAETVYYTYGGTALQQIVLNVELSVLEYESVSITVRSVGFTVDAEGNYTFDAASGGTFAQLRAYIVTDQGGHASYNDKGASGFDPVNYYIQSTGTNKELFSVETIDGGWSVFTFDLAALKFWNEGTRLDAFAFGFVSSTKAVEVKSVVFNEADKTQQYTVNFVGRLGNELVESQTVAWNTSATKPAKLEDADGCVYTGEWLDASGEVFDFSKKLRSNVTLYPEYTVESKYSWTGEDVGRDFMAVYNADKTLPAFEYAHNGNTVFTYNNGSGNALKQISSDVLNLPIGDYRYLTLKWRTVDYKGYTYNEAGIFALLRIYVVTDLGGYALTKDKDDADSFFKEFKDISATEVREPIDMSAKFEGGWYVVTVDLEAFPYYADGTTLKAITVGATASGINAIEVSEITLSTALADRETHTVSFVDEAGNAIEGLEAQTVPYGKAAVMPQSSLVPEKAEHTFNYWADEKGNEFVFGAVVTENVVLHPVYTNVWVGTNYTFKGQDLVSNLQASYERYGVTVTKSQPFYDLSLDDAGNAYFDYSQITNATNMAVTMLDANIRVHEGSQFVIKYKSNKYDEYTVNRLSLCVAFKGQDPVSQITNTNTTSYYQYKDIAKGTTSGSSEAACVSFVTDESGVVTVTYDLYAIQQAYKAKGIVEEGVDLGFIASFTFMICETNNGTSPIKNGATITYYGFEFKDVQMETKPVYNLLRQRIVDTFTASYERYGNRLNDQKALSLDENGEAYFDYSVFGKPNMTLTVLDAGIKLQEGAKLVIKLKSSTFDTYTANRINLCVAYKGQNPETKIHSADTSQYYQWKDIAQGTLQGENASVFVTYAYDADGMLTVTYDLYAMAQAASAAAEDGVDYTVLNAYTFMIVETNSGTGAKTSNATLTYYSVEYSNVVIG